ncbi:sulfur carrier protein ThiS [Candidatus Pelagibacter sp.]|nr:sulfur carrier protein ThiS [Candidatus Pelagibacter sp.]
MRKIKKIEIRVNGRVKSISDKYKMSDLVKNLKIPMKKVAIELNQEIIDKKKINKIILKKKDKIEIVHFIGGG